MCSILAFSDNSGMADLQSCMECILNPLGGLVTVRGFIAGMIYTTSAAVTNKRLVAPELMVAQSARDNCLKSTVRRRLGVSSVTLFPMISMGGDAEEDGGLAGLPSPITTLCS